MPKKFFARKTFSEETPIFDSKTIKKIPIFETRGIMQMIMDIKLKADMKAHYARHLKLEKFKLQRDQNDSYQSEISHFSDSRNANEPVSKPKRHTFRAIKLIDNVIKEDFSDDGVKIYRGLLEKVIRKLIRSASTLKNDLKKVKGLNVNQKFLMINVHTCDHCGQTFAKPCALGGHISKVHSEERRKRQRLDENLESPVARKY